MRLVGALVATYLSGTMCKLKLEQNLSECPVYWANMVKYIRKNNRSPDDIILYMKKFNSIVDFPSRTVTFETEEDLTAFILTWS